MRRLTIDLQRHFFPGLALLQYQHQWPNRVWKLFHYTPERYTATVSAALNRLDFGCDYRDPQAYRVGIRAALFIIYGEWPEQGQIKYTLLLDLLGDLSTYQNTTTLQDITHQLYILDI